MSDGAALLAYCHEHPDDDTARLVYADWLEEQGDAARAEFIRVQLALAKLWPFHPDKQELAKREQALLKPHQKVWKGSLPGNVRGRASFCRGFPTAFAFTAEELLRQGRAIRQRGPIDSLILDACTDRMSELVASGLLAGVQKLSLCAEDLSGEDLAALANTPDLGQLRTLDVENVDASCDGWDELWASPDLRNLKELTAGFCESWVLSGLTGKSVSFRLRRLDMDEAGLVDVDCKKLGNAPCLSQLEELSFGGEDLGTTEQMQLLGSRMMKNLRWLSLGDTELSKRGIRRLLTALEPDRLEYLELRACPMDEGGLAPLLASPQLSNLLVLEVHDCPEEDAGLEQLARAKSPGRLRELNLWDVPVTDGEVAALLASPLVRSLTRLSLGSNYGLGPETARAIATSENLPSLRTLHLDGNRIGHEGAAALANSSRLPSLSRLSLNSTAIGDPGGRALLGSALLDRLEHLSLEGNRLKKETRALFKQRQAGREWSV